MLAAIFWFFCGAVVTGFVAHRRPEWFARVVKEGAGVVNKASDEVKAAIQEAGK